MHLASLLWPPLLPAVQQPVLSGALDGMGIPSPSAAGWRAGCATVPVAASCRAPGWEITRGASCIRTIGKMYYVYCVFSFRAPTARRNACGFAAMPHHTHVNVHAKHIAQPEGLLLVACPCTRGGSRWGLLCMMKKSEAWLWSTFGFGQTQPELASSRLRGGVLVAARGQPDRGSDKRRFLPPRHLAPAAKP
jgi:hypothetical protein